MNDQDIFLEQALVEEGHITAAQLAEARTFSTEKNCDIVDALVQTETVTSRRIALVKADVCESPYVDLSDFEPCFANTAYVPRSMADRYCLFPMFMINGVLTLAMDDPLNLEASDQVRQIAKCEVDAVLADREQLRALINRVYSLSHNYNGVGDDEPVVELDEDTSTQPVVAAVNQILADAVEQRASDVHLNPDEHDLHLRYRIDGVLHQKQGPPLSMHNSLVQRLKVMAHLDLTQTRRPQDGKFRFRHGGVQADVRMSTLPTVCGENVVLRLLTNTQAIHDFLELGIPAAMSNDLDEILAQPYGMLLVTGPTGSGKTTTLYTALSKLNDPSRNIMTIEDPVEIRLPYIRQIQAHPEIGLTFASALRSILRQDPDVVLLGEIRDDETARIALQAALTGHMVLSTVHTNDAAGAVSRIRDFNIPPFVINSAVLGVIGQRLVRRICSHCTSPDDVSEITRHRFKLSEEDAQHFSRGTGCGKCGQTGYRGRVGIYELLKFTPEIQRLVETGASTNALQDLATAKGMRLMWQDGLDKARLGHTTLDEVGKAASINDLVQDTKDDARMVA